MPHDMLEQAASGTSYRSRRPGVRRAEADRLDAPVVRGLEVR